LFCGCLRLFCCLNVGLPIDILSPTQKVQPISSSGINQYQLISTNINQFPSVSQYLSVLFTKYLYPGLFHPEVKNLQIFLSQYPDLYPEQKITGYYGNLTKQAVQRFQLKYNITNESDKAFGLVGPKTRAKLNELITANSANQRTSEQTSNQNLINQLKQTIQTIEAKIQEIIKQIQILKPLS